MGGRALSTGPGPYHREDRAQGSQRPHGQGRITSESIGNRATLSKRDLRQKAALPGFFWEGPLPKHLASLSYLQVDLQRKGYTGGGPQPLSTFTSLRTPDAFS